LQIALLAAADSIFRLVGLSEMVLRQPTKKAEPRMCRGLGEHVDANNRRVPRLAQLTKKRMSGQCPFAPHDLTIGVACRLLRQRLGRLIDCRTATHHFYSAPHLLLHSVVFIVRLSREKNDLRPTLDRENSGALAFNVQSGPKCYNDVGTVKNEVTPKSVCVPIKVFFRFAEQLPTGRICWEKNF
jgi:hypothetical protein